MLESESNGQTAVKKNQGTSNKRRSQKVIADADK